jgi:hypothetical protein
MQPKVTQGPVSGHFKLLQSGLGKVHARFCLWAVPMGIRVGSHAKFSSNIAETNDVIWEADLIR